MCVCLCVFFKIHLPSPNFSSEATCITEMSVMMACWKQNNFADGRCSNETKSFYKCVQNSQVCSHKEVCTHKKYIIAFIYKHNVSLIYILNLQLVLKFCAFSISASVYLYYLKRCALEKKGIFCVRLWCS